jgi:hypothetical protein
VAAAVRPAARASSDFTWRSGSQLEMAGYPLIMTNIAMENGPFIDGLLNMVIFHGYVK